MKQLEHHENFIKASLLAGLSVASIAKILNKSKHQATYYEVNKFINAQRAIWASDLLNSPVEQYIITQALENKQIKRKPSPSRSPIPSFLVARALNIVQKNGVVSQSLTGVNKLLEREGHEPINYEQLCRVVRRWRGC
ncbi:hypothetical protein [Colwellia sp. MEBiC06753]